jgi:hypothetical protein
MFCHCHHTVGFSPHLKGQLPLEPRGVSIRAGRHCEYRCSQIIMLPARARRSSCWGVEGRSGEVAGIVGRWAARKSAAASTMTDPSGAAPSRSAAESGGDANIDARRSCCFVAVAGEDEETLLAVLRPYRRCQRGGYWRQRKHGGRQKAR